MPFPPNNSTVVPPPAPTAAHAAHLMPWGLANLSGIGSSFDEDPDLSDLEVAAVAELEFFFASRVPASQPSIAPAPHPATVIEITTNQPLARPSEEEPLSPLQLQRAGEQGDPVALPASAQAGLRHIAGTPLTSPPAGGATQRIPTNDFSYADDLLSSPTGNHPVLNHVTPEQTPDAQEFQHDIARPAFSWIFNVARIELPQRTSTTTTPVPQSAPPTLERLPAIPPTVLQMRALQGGLGQLQDSALPGLDAAPHSTYAFDVYAAYQLRAPQLPATEAVDKDSGSDTGNGDEAVGTVGSPPHPYAM